MSDPSALLLGAGLIAALLLIAAHRLYARPLRKAEAKRDAPSLALPDPTPLLQFDLATARTRDHIYANKQVRSATSTPCRSWLNLFATYSFGIPTSRPWRISRCISIVSHRRRGTSIAEADGAIADWIEIDYNYERDLRQKKAVIEEHGSKVLTSMPENDEASGELLETLVDYLPKVSSAVPLTQAVLIYD